MTDEERQLIQTLADHVRNAPAPQIDRDADNLIRGTIGTRPDALYILTQTVLIQEMAIGQAKQQMEQLKQQATQPPANFLPNQPAPPQPSGYRAGGYQGSGYQRGDYAPPPPQQPPVQYVVDPQPTGGRFSSFLHNAAQTAAGVVAGEVAFSALSSIFGGHGGGGGFFGGGGGYGISPGSETIINNYYDGGRGGAGGFGGNDRSLEDSGLSPDLEDRRFAGGDSDNRQDDTQQRDDTQQDDLQQDDTSNDASDDGSSYDDGSGSNDV